MQRPIETIVIIADMFRRKQTKSRKSIDRDADIITFVAHQLCYGEILRLLVGNGAPTLFQFYKLHRCMSGYKS